MLNDFTAYSGRKLVDEQGRAFELGQLLGVGGQGAVFTTDHPRLVAKVAAIPRSNAAKRAAWHAQIRQVARFGLDDLQVAAPESLFESDEFVGYIMQLMEDMMPIRRLASPPKGADDLAAWYHESGGLHRRLHVLAETADVLAVLHQRGLAYGDVSPTNLFISADVDEFGAWLIDSDNIAYFSSPAAKAVFAPGYGAPETVRGESGPSTQTDAYGFAVVAFETLTLLHPFLGDLVMDGDPELEERAFRGELPWVDDLHDLTNATQRGIPRDRVLTNTLRGLFAQTFEDGRGDPNERPTMAQWADALHRAADMAIFCACGASFRAAQKRCPWCDAARRQDFGISQLAWYGVHSGIDAKTPTGSIFPPEDARMVVLTGDGPAKWTRNQLFGECQASGRQEVLSLELLKAGVRVYPAAGFDLWYSEADATELKVTEWQDTLRPLKRPVTLTKKQRVHLGAADVTHAVISFGLA